MHHPYVIPEVTLSTSRHSEGKDLTSHTSDVLYDLVDVARLGRPRYVTPPLPARVCPRRSGSFISQIGISASVWPQGHSVAHSRSALATLLELLKRTALLDNGQHGREVRSHAHKF